MRKVLPRIAPASQKREVWDGERTNTHLELADGFGGPRARDDGFAAIDDLVKLEQRYGLVYASQANCVDLATSST
jgi:hypothetical protein